MTVEAPPEHRGALGGAAGSMASAVGGGLLAALALLVTGQVLGLALSVVIRGTDLETWARVGLLVSLTAVRAEVVATFQPAAGLPVGPLPAGPVESHVVPMALTIGFLWLAARAGRRAARRWPAAPPLARAAVAAAGAGVPVAIVAALAASLATLRIPSRMTVEVDAASAAVWAGVLAAAAAAIGAYLESASGSATAAVIRGGVAAYLWTLGLLVAGVLVVATLEPEVTRAYVDGLRGNGSAGVALFGAHVLALPTQSALLLVPASGSCLDLVASGATAARLCPWDIDAISPLAGAIVSTDPVRLSPWLWLLVAAPPVSAFLGGRRAGAGRSIASGIARGALGGFAFAALSVLGAVFASPRIVVPLIVDWLRLEIRPWSLRVAGLLCLWGGLGGAIGGRSARRTYEEPELPRPTSA